MSRVRIALLLPLLLFSENLLVVTPRRVVAQDTSEDEQRQLQIAQRFLEVLEKNPRRGTAFDKVYAHHLDWGTLDNFVHGLQERVAKTPTDGAAWMILGMIASRRGNDVVAVDAFGKAEESLPQNAIASYYLGQALVLAGQSDQSVAAFQRAIDRRPAQVDLLDIFQALGRVHQRARRNEAALAAWNRLEQLFPNDARVQEQIAATLVEEGQYAAAVPRYEKLISLSKDEYRRTMFRIESADLKVRMGNAAAAITDLETLLGQLNPDSWLFREVRRKIEDIFLRSENYDGLAKYYEQRLAKQSQDVDAMARLAKVLARQARLPEAQQWLEKALQLAPNRRDLRLVFVDQLVDEQRYADAIKQYEALDQAEPGNPDVLREWGKLILRDGSRSEADRRAAAEQVWRRLVTARPKDPLVATQVADLLRHADMRDQALELYRQAVELAPDQPQFREYLGEYYHILQRRDEALATWRLIAAGNQKTAANVARLAEVLTQNGYLRDALPEIATACQLDPKDLSLLLKAAELYEKAEQYADAERYLADAEKLAANADESETVLARQLRLFQTDDSLVTRASKLEEEIQASVAPNARQYYQLARLLEAAGRYPEASAAIRRAVELDPKSIPGMATAARIREQAGEIQAATEMNRLLANTDRRSRTLYLTNVARLETQLGHPDEALQAGRDLITASPGNSENHTFFSQLCFRLGRVEEGLDSLRRAVRANPSDTQMTMSLAQALADRLRTDEAIELYWQARDRATDLDTKLACVSKLSELYLQINKFERLLERLERSRRDSDTRRETTLCLAQAHQSAGDLGKAREELESLLEETTRDTHLLQELSKLSQGAGDLASAIKYQTQLVKLAPGAESEFRLAGLLARMGSLAEANSILTRLALREDDPIQILQNLDRLLDSNQNEAVLQITAAKLNGSPQNWELLYREGVAFAASNSEEAVRRFQAILKQKHDDDEPGAALTATKKKGMQPNVTTAPISSRRGLPAAQGKLAQFNALSEIRQAVGFRALNSDPFGSIRRTTFWGPPTFGQARVAALTWLLKFADANGVRDEFLKARQLAAESANASVTDRWDWLYLLKLTDQQDQLYAAAQKLAKQRDPDGQTLFLAEIQGRLPNSATARWSGASSRTQPWIPVSSEDVDLALQCARDLVARANPESSAIHFAANLVHQLSAELRRAGRETEAEELFGETAKKLSKSAQSLMRLQQAVIQENDKEMLAAVEDWLQATKRQLVQSTSAAARDESRIAVQSLASFLTPVMGKLGAKKQNAEVLRLLDGALDCSAAARIVATPLMPAPPPASASMVLAGIPTQRQSSLNFQLWYGNQAQAIASFVLSTKHLDLSTAQVARNALYIFQKNDAVPEFFAHVEQRAGLAAAGDQAREYTLLSTLYLWNQQTDRAIEALEKAVAAAPSDISLRVETAQLLRQQQRFEAALAMLDGVPSIDPTTLPRRELMALDLAERLGDVERGKAAAERLFGTRLSDEENFKLAGHLQRLGMNEMADAVMARTQRKTSNPATLVTLMNQYAKEGKPDQAAQVARQIVRSPPSMAYPGVQTGLDPTRFAALRYLQTVGQLADMISRLERQLETSPQSQSLNLTLLEYYKAAGEREKAVQLEKKLLAMVPDDPAQRFQLAERLVAQGMHAEACDHFLAAIQRDPQLLHRNTVVVVQSFMQAGRSVELTTIVVNMEVNSSSQLFNVAQVIRVLAADRRTNETAVRLFRRAWNAVPDQRDSLLVISRSAAIWALPEVAEHLQQRMIPTDDQLRQDPWFGFNSQLFSPLGTTATISKGRATPQPNDNILSSSTATTKLRDTVAAAVQQKPSWLGGRLILAILELRTGRLAEAKASVESILQQSTTVPVAHAQSFVLEAMPHTDLREISIRLFERALQDPTQLEVQGNALQQLVQLYVTAGRREDARALLLKTMPDKTQLDRDPRSLMLQLQKIRMAQTQLVAMGYHLDALRISQQLLELSNQIQENGTMDVVVKEQMLLTGRMIFETSKRQLTSGNLSHSIAELLKPTAPTDGSVPTLDLFLTTSRSPDGSQMTINSFVLELLDKGQTLPSESELAEISQSVQALKKENANDVNSLVAVAVWGLRSKDPEEWKGAGRDLLKWMEQNPLEVIPPEQQPTEKQRLDAGRQLGLWFAARRFLDEEPVREIGQQLAARALAAAERQNEDGFAEAILYDWGMRCAKLKDKQTAEQLWSKLLDRTLATTQSDRSKIRPLTEAKFAQVMNIARFSVDTAPNLSLRAVRVALAGGPPVPNLTPTAGSNLAMAPVASSSGTALRPSFTTSRLNMLESPSVYRAVQEMVTKWQSFTVPPVQIYETLRSIAFCPARPQEILLYEVAPRIRPNTLASQLKPESLANLLGPAAVAAGRVDDLKQEIAARQGNPQVELPALVLLLHVQFAAGDRSAAAQSLRAIDEFVTKKPTPTHLNLAIHAALLANDVPELSPIAKSILDRALKSSR